MLGLRRSEKGFGSETRSAAAADQTRLRRLSRSDHCWRSGEIGSGAGVHATGLSGGAGAKNGADATPSRFGADGMRPFQAGLGAPSRAGAATREGAGARSGGVSEGLGPKAETSRTSAAAVAARMGIPTWISGEVNHGSQFWQRPSPPRRRPHRSHQPLE